MKARIRRCVLLVALFCGLTEVLSVQAASFDCAKAQSKVEDIICDNPEISKLDDELAIQYRAALRSPFQHDLLRKKQQQWLSERDKCLDKACLKNAYETRTLELMNGIDVSKHWYIQEGKGRPLCEMLAHIANASPSIGIEPNIPWEQVLSIDGVAEPKWTELDPAQYVDLFLSARKHMLENAGNSLDEQALPFGLWFKSPKMRWAAAATGKKQLSEEEAVQNYRDFARRGGSSRCFTSMLVVTLRLQGILFSTRARKRISQIGMVILLLRSLG